MAFPDLVGGGSTIFDTQRVYEEQGLLLGTVGVLNGRTYVWCSYSGSSTIAAGDPLVAADLTRDTLDLDITTTGLAVGQSQIDGITPGGAAIAAHAFNDGYMAVVDGGGEGTIYEIERSNAFTASTADGDVFLKSQVEVASDASTQVSLLKNKYADVQQSNKFGRASFVGVSNVAVPAGNSTTQYFWAQRNGYCPVFIEGAIMRGVSVRVSDTTDGRLESVTQDAEVIESIGGRARHVIPFDLENIVGVMVTDAVDGEVQIVDLQNPLV